jgi:7-cyano-7-deazaguanine tRNA-ribosyltransferase
VHTPTLLPVFNPNISLLSASEVSEKTGAEMVITNAYILYKSDELAEEALEKGVHRILNFNGAVMTDSGAFQIYQYNRIKIRPDTILRFQTSIGSDAVTILDIITSPSASYQTAHSALKNTLARARRAAGYLMKEYPDILLSCPIQGGIHLNLRKKCASQISKINCTINPIGGVVPLLESYRFEEVVEIILNVKQNLSPERAVHLFGGGHPLIFPIAVLLGCDLFDSASYAKYARTDRLIFRDCTRHLDDIRYLSCTCPVCKKYSIEELKALSVKERRKAIELHNLFVSFSVLQELKCAIQEGTIWEYVEMHCRSHPALLSALKKLKHYRAYLEKYEPLSRNTGFFYVCPESIYRPAVYRVRKRILETYRPYANTVITLSLLDNDFKKARAVENRISKYNVPLIIQTIFGTVPFELADIYPIGQAVLPTELDKEAFEDTDMFAKTFFETLDATALVWDGKHTVDFLKTMFKPTHITELEKDLKKLKSIASFQFGCDAAELLLSGNIKITKSSRTKKIRNVYKDDRHILSVRAYDSFFTLKPEGAFILHSNFKRPRYRIIVEEESASFNRAGKNVFAKFVVDCDSNIIPGDEVLVVDEDDNLVAIGRAVLNRAEMLCFKAGIAVKVREGIIR